LPVPQPRCKVRVTLPLRAVRPNGIPKTLSNIQIVSEIGRWIVQDCKENNVQNPLSVPTRSLKPPGEGNFSTTEAQKARLDRLNGEGLAVSSQRLAPRFPLCGVPR
jgi:hypothetical protein